MPKNAKLLANYYNTDILNLMYFKENRFEVKTKEEKPVKTLNY